MDNQNEVQLSGVVANDPEMRALGDGREVMQWRMKIQRADVGSDSIPCSAESKQVIKSVGAAGKGAALEISGALRSRFWNTGSGMGTRVEVDVTRAKRLR